MVKQPVLKIFSKICGQFWVAIKQAIYVAQDHKIWPGWCKVGWFSCIKISQYYSTTVLQYSTAVLQY